MYQWCVSIDHVVQVVVKIGCGTVMGKFNIRSEVHTSQYTHRIVCYWVCDEFVDCVLLFGLRSAPKIFNLVADALQWVVSQRGVKWVFHYLDDSPCLGAPQSEECHQALVTMYGGPGGHTYDQ